MNAVARRHARFADRDRAFQQFREEVGQQRRLGLQTGGIRQRSVGADLEHPLVRRHRPRRGDHQREFILGEFGDQRVTVEQPVRRRDRLHVPRVAVDLLRALERRDGVVPDGKELNWRIVVTQQHVETEGGVGLLDHGVAPGVLDLHLLAGWKSETVLRLHHIEVTVDPLDRHRRRDAPRVHGAGCHVPVQFPVGGGELDVTVVANRELRSMPAACGEIRLEIPGDGEIQALLGRADEGQDDGEKHGGRSYHCSRFLRRSCAVA